MVPKSNISDIKLVIRTISRIEEIEYGYNEIYFYQIGKV